MLESIAISNFSKLSTPSEYRMWSKKVKHAHGQVRLYARRVLHRLDTVKEKDIQGELQLGHANTTAMKAVAEHVNMARMSDMKGGGTRYEGIAEHMTKLNRVLWSILLDECEGEAWMKINTARDEGLWAYTRLHQWFTKTT